jgi:NAD(P)-dependent dehydrogenase (short-subunit alcohol dehydrogenase family)
MPKWSAYAMSKGALNTFTEFAATELKQYKITINSILLNMVDTPMFRLGLDEEKVKALGPMDPNLLPPYFAFFATRAARKYTGLNVDIDLVKKAVSLKNTLPEKERAEADWSTIKDIAEQEMNSKQFKQIRKVKKLISFLMNQ